ncbi:uncharacterized protein LOC141901631 [Tubulanus polymorphus]|uniref:uncharacterized protein LOC141901631 n=1 Tax=Tubulanus polymorphus TaxID=672921 RepID=UPI003DA590CD
MASKHIVSFDEKHSSSLLEQLHSQRTRGIFCDVVLKVFGQQYMVHSNVLAASSPYFSSFFGQNASRRFSPAAPQIVELQIGETGASESFSSAIEKIIDFMYSGILHISGDNIVQVLQLSKVLQMEKLVDLCSPHIIELLDTQRKIIEKVEPRDESNCELNAPSTRQQQTIVSQPIIAGGKTDLADDELKVFGLTLDICGNEGEQSENDEVDVIRQRSCDDVVDSKDEDNMIIATDENVISEDGRPCMDIHSTTDSEKEKIPKILICSECTFTTTKPYRLSRHMTCHTGGRYKCMSCDFSTTKLRELTAHNKVHKHMNNICTFCDFEAKNGEEMRDHLAKHAGHLPYFCNYCDKRFKTRAQMNLHAPKHKDEKPFVCKICGLGFKWKHALKGHYLVHTKEKNHLCDICGYATAHKSQLKAHHLIHTGDLFKCTHTGCTYRTIKKQNLTAHLMTHTREKPHQCDVCGQAFSLVKNMKRHMLLHSSERPHHCTQCPFATTRYDKLNEHMNKTHAAGKPIKKRRVVNSYVKSQSMVLTHVPVLDSSENSLEKNSESSAKLLSGSDTLIHTNSDLSQVIDVEHLNSMNSHVKKTQLLLTSDVSKLLHSVRHNTIDESEHENLIQSVEKSLPLQLEPSHTLTASGNANLVTLQPLQLVEIAFSTSSDPEFK